MEKQIQIYYTSDTHGHVFPVNYASKRPEDSGLLNLSAQIAKDGNTLVLDVERRELYWAKCGCGAWLNQSPSHTSDCREIAEMMITTPDIQYTFLERHPYQQQMIQLAQRVRAVLTVGSQCRADYSAKGRRRHLYHSGSNLPLNQKSTVLALNTAELKTHIFSA